MSKADAVAKAQSVQDGPWRDEYLDAQSPKAILIRMLRNLFSTARDARKIEEMYRYVDTLLALDPESASDRFLRAILAYQTERYAQSRRDADWLLERRPGQVDLQTIEDLSRALSRLDARGP